MMEVQSVILVTEQDEITGTMEKMEAHKKGVLHRAFSIFIFNSKGEMLLQQRSAAKYHNGELWTNACCSHPGEGETLEHAAHRKLKQEFGFDCHLNEKFSFIYKAEGENGLSEHEFDHVLIGMYDGKIHTNPQEIEEWKYVNIEELK